MHTLKQHIALIITALTVISTVSGQSVRLTPYRASSALYLDAGQFYDFNIYEHHRLGLGMTWVTPNENADPSPRVFLGQWKAQASVAYGTMDHDFKYRANLQLRLPGRRDVRLSLSAFDDLEAAASHTLEPYRMTSTDHNSHYLWSRFAGVKGMEAGCTVSLSKQMQLSVSVRQSWEDYRFDSRGLFYPTLDPGRQQSARPFSELHTRLDWNQHAALLVRAGSSCDSLCHRYITAIAQYDGPIAFDGLTLFGQLGYATNGTPYSRLFDLGGTGGTPYFFRHTFLTLQPHTLVAHAYAVLFLNYTCPKPLWQLGWSNPQPFAQVGLLYGLSSGSAYDCSLPLAAPDHGLAEAAAGINRLLRWGVLDIGVAAACQLAPSNASYSAAPGKRTALMAVATLAL